MDFKKMNLDSIIDWCKANNQVAWLKAEFAKQIPNKDGEGTHEITFIELKYNFVKKFMPDLLPKAKAKKPSMKERIAAL